MMFSHPGPEPPQTFQRDHHLRQRLGFAESTFEHKAKLNLNWLAWLLHEHTAPGSIVLDPMAGTGSILLAALNQHPTLAGDVERYWARLLNRNALRIHSRHLIVAPMLTCRWNAARLPLPDASLDAIVTSPPYFDLFSNWNRKQANYFDGRHIGPNGLSYGDHAHQIGNIHIYDDYLRAMRTVYLECRRVLRPGGKLILILGNKVRERRIVPVTEDTQALVTANGFDLLAAHDRKTIPSRWRRIHSQQDAGYPVIAVETALVFQKSVDPGPQHKRCFVIEVPNGASSPGRTLFRKQLDYCIQRRPDLLLALDSTGLFRPIQESWYVDGANYVHLGDVPSTVWTGTHPAKARVRREWCYRLVREELVAKFGLGDGDQIQLHITDRYARYLQQRLNTFGAVATIPTAHLNLGQKLAYYTERTGG
ncbi:MAG TPA: DNA methyltransferase [Anaerolineae bacterium]|nr:DNA methyltransferase [Anaerolineae bacterium]